jgi:hypothetical protein
VAGLTVQPLETVVVVEVVTVCALLVCWVDLVTQSVPNNRPEVVLTVMVCDQTWTMKMEKVTIIIIIQVMGHTMKKVEGGTGYLTEVAVFQVLSGAVLKR